MHDVHFSIEKYQITSSHSIHHYPASVLCPCIANWRALLECPPQGSGKMVLIDMEVIDYPLNYNILLGYSYMYIMKVVT